MAKFLILFILFFSFQVVCQESNFPSTTVNYSFEQIRQQSSIIKYKPTHKFSCFGIGFKSDINTNASEFTIKYRSFNNGIPSEWITAEADFLPEDTKYAMYFTDALFTSDAQSHDEIELVYTGLIPFTNLQLTLFDGNYRSTGEINVPNIETLATTIATTVCPAFPPIIMRTEWCGGSASCTGVNASYNVVNINATHLVIHHGASPNTYTSGQDVVRSYWNYHVNTLGWADIGYNYLIDKFGNLYQGRRNLNLPTQDVRGSHAGASNPSSIGVCFLGNADVTTATASQLQKLYDLLAWWFNHKALSPLSSAGLQTQAFGYQTIPRICGHLDIGQTSCPGTDLYGRLASIRTNVKSKIDACNTSTVPSVETIAPTSTITSNYVWQSNNFIAEISDADNPGGSGLQETFFQITDFSGGNWRSNSANGFYNDEFNATTIHPEWTALTGTWGINTNALAQSNQTVTNSNIYTPLTQTSTKSYLYHTKLYIGGPGSNKRAGFHFFVDNPSLPNRGNNYFVWFRQNTNQYDLSKVTNDVLSTLSSTTLTIPSATWFDVKVMYTPSTGVIKTFFNNQLINTYTDPSPITSGNFISLRNGDCDGRFDDFKVYQERNFNADVIISVGSATTTNARYQSTNPNQPASRVTSLVKDVANNWSTPVTKNFKIDWTAPTTTINSLPIWQTTNFSATYNDNDNVNGSTIMRRFYNVSDNDGSKWSANSNRGFFNENFTVNGLQQFTVATGNWSSASGVATQTNQTISNTNMYAALNHTLSNRYCFSFDMKLSGTGTNRRGGFHFMATNPTLPNRGNSYLVWFRIESQALEFYRITGDTLNQVKVVSLTTVAGQNYAVKIVYDRITGEMFVYRDGKLISTWIDETPLAAGNFVSFRSGNSEMEIDNFMVYRTRTTTTAITAGSLSTDIRYENQNPSLFAGEIHSLVCDSAHNLSASDILQIKTDFSAPLVSATVNDGLAADIATFNTPNSISANWTASADPNSGINNYWLSIGTAPGLSDVLSFVNVGNNLSSTQTGLSLTNGQLYYINIRAENNAGLLSGITSSNGQMLQTSSTAPTAAVSSVNSICVGQPVALSDASSGGPTSWEWTMTGGTPSSASFQNTSVTYTAAGVYTVSLMVANATGSNTAVSTITVLANPVINVTSAQAQICAGESATLNASGASTYTWSPAATLTSSNGNVVVANPTVTTAYNIIGNNGTCNGNGMYTLVVNACTGIEQLENANEFSVFPNPFLNEINITYNLKTDSKIEVMLYDMLGKEIFHQTYQEITGHHSKLIFVDDAISQGMYSLKITIGGEKIYRKLIKQ